ncbi:IS110 family transposase [Orrella sp. 11846]|uniref:IS110 family transposase n=1 Tax=Orrella sp. 11846 TaxID=3409913 RepID=UPI003B5C8BC6
MKITTIGLDLAKNVFQVHGADTDGKLVLRKKLRRDQVMVFFANLEPCLIGMEACGSAHHWARQLQSLGHEVRLISPQFVKPYVKSNKHDAADAEAICEAVTRPTMRFVPIKNVEQQAMLSIHRAREGFIGDRTATGNRIRGLLAEFGLIVPQGIHHLRTRVPEFIEDGTIELPGLFRRLIDQLLEHLNWLDQQIDILEEQIKVWHRQNDDSQRLAQIPGIGMITATAMVATIGDARNFRSGRELAAWVGLVPRQHSTGGKQTLLGISKRGDAYLRKLLVHGARAVAYHIGRKTDPDLWLKKLIERRPMNVAVVAQANKTVRIVWALLVHGREFRPDYAKKTAA